MLTSEIWIGKVKPVAAGWQRAAVQASRASEFVRAVEARLAQTDQTLDVFDTPVPYHQWVANFGDDPQLNMLALKVLRHPPVALETTEQYRANFLIQTTLEDVVPLDGQFGQFPLMDVPAVLEPPLFDPPELSCFAVLDGARLSELETRLEAAGLEHRSLLNGDAVAEYGETGPWLVRLPPTGSFTRQLFTRDPTAIPDQSVWDKTPAIYLRTKMNLNDLRAHLRRFLRIRDVDGKWMVFRFYDPRVMAAYLAGIGGWEERVRHWFETNDGQTIDSIITPCADETTSVFSLNVPVLSAPPPPRPSFILTDRDRRPLTQYSRDATLKKMARDLRVLMHKDLSAHTEVDVWLSVHTTAQRLDAVGIVHAGDLMRFAALDLHYGHGFETRDPTGTLASILNSNEDGRTKFKRFTKRLSEIEKVI